MKRFLGLWLILVLLSWYPVQAARTFTPSTTALTNATAVVSPPFTICAWFNSASLTANQTIWAVHSADSLGRHQLRVEGGVTDNVSMASRSAGTVVARSTTTYAANTWHSACGSVTTSGSTARWVYLNGAGFASNTATENPTPTATSIGSIAGTGAGEYFSGSLEHIAVWNVELSAAEVAAFASGVHPHCIRPLNRASYVPVWGNNSPELDVWAARAWTLVGTPAKTVGGAPVGRLSDCMGRG